MDELFDPESGYLPVGVHTWEWDDFLGAFVWNQRRRFLAKGLYRALQNLRDAGCRAAIVDGSFVSAKDLPGDYDAAFDPFGVDGDRVDPVLLRHKDGRRSMKAKYFGDIFPWGAMACSKTGLLYQEFFQRDRAGEAKSVVLIDLKRLP